MQEQIVSYDVAILAKEKGFDEVCRKVFNTEREISSFSGYALMQGFNKNSTVHLYDTNSEEFEYPSLHCTAPTQALLQKWLREVHCIHFHIYYDNTRKWGIDVYSIASELEEGYCAGLLTQPLQFEGITTYEEALEIGEKWALDYIGKL